MLKWLKKQFSQDRHNGSPVTSESNSAAMSPPSPPSPPAHDAGSSNYLEQAEAALKQGKIEEAERHYQLAIQQEPGNAQACNRLGDLYYERQDFQRAVEQYRQAVSLQPDFFDALLNLGLALAELSQYAEAENCYRQAITIRSQDAVAHYNLSLVLQSQNRLPEALAACQQALTLRPQFSHGQFQLGTLLHMLGRLSEAEAAFQKTLEIDTQFVRAYWALANMLQQANRLDEAARHYRKLLEIAPHITEARNALLAILLAQRQFPEAEAIYRQICLQQPDDASSHYHLGIFLKQQGRHAEAMAALRLALQKQPGYAQAHFELAMLLEDQGELVQAEAALRQAVALQADFMIALGSLAVMLMNQGKYGEAEKYLQRCLELNPNEAAIHDNLGLIRYLQAQYANAIPHFKRALELQPQLLNAHNNLGSAYKRLGRLDEAAASYRTVLQLNPHSPAAHNNIAMVYVEQRKIFEAEAAYRQVLALTSSGYGDAHVGLGNILNDQGQQAAALSSYRNALLADSDYLDAHSNLLFQLCFGDLCTPAEYQAEVERYAKKLREKIQPYTDWQLRPQGQPGRKLRVGLVSGDLGAHPVGYFLESVLKHIDSGKIEFVAFSNKTRNDEVNTRLRSYFTAWKSIENIENAAAADLIRGQGVDLLIDLAGHTANNRLSVFAYKPAPVQVSWLGYFATTGVPGMDYLLADHVSVPDDQQEYFSEKIWYLPETRLCFTPPAIKAQDLVLMHALPALSKGYITFGCFQSSSKINEQTLGLWARVLHGLPTARLRLQCRQLDSDAARKQMELRFQNLGIGAERLQLLGPSSRDAYLTAHQEVDMILDTFPYAGGTTTCEALWMGVPTLSLQGSTMASMQGLSLLSYAGLKDWVAKDEQAYVEMAINHASQPEKLAQLRAGLREQMMGTPVFDAPRFANYFELALLGMWAEFTRQK